MSKLLSKERITAGPGFNRWLVPPASIAIHLCIGSVYAWSTAGVLGPLAITSLRESAIANAIQDLAAKVDSQAFRSAFGAGLDQLDVLIEQRTVTIAKLMDIAPAGTVNPTSSVYNTTMYLMAVLLGVALLSNAFMRPVDPKHHMQP
jgi:hypothetical protein